MSDIEGKRPICLWVRFFLEFGAAIYPKIEKRTLHHWPFLVRKWIFGICKLTTVPRDRDKAPIVRDS